MLISRGDSRQDNRAELRRRRAGLHLGPQLATGASPASRKPGHLAATVPDEERSVIRGIAARESVGDPYNRRSEKQTV